MEIQKIVEFFQNYGILIRIEYQSADELILSLPVFAKPGARVEKLGVDNAGNLTVFIKERAKEGAANKGIIHFLSKRIGLSQSSISLDKGHKSKIKKIKLSFSFTKEKDVFYYLNKMELAFE